MIAMVYRIEIANSNPSLRYFTTYTVSWLALRRLEILSLCGTFLAVKRHVAGWTWKNAKPFLLKLYLDVLNPKTITTLEWLTLPKTTSWIHWYYPREKNYQQQKALNIKIVLESKRSLTTFDPPHHPNAPLIGLIFLEGNTWHLGSSFAEEPPHAWHLQGPNHSWSPCHVNPKGGRSVRGYDKPIRGSGAIDFPGGIM